MTMKLSTRQLKQRFGFSLLTLMTFFTIIPIIGVVIYIIYLGFPAINLEFLSGFPREGMREGGILPAIIGTLYLTLGTAIFAVPWESALQYTSQNMPLITRQPS